MPTITQPLTQYQLTRLHASVRSAHRKQEVIQAALDLMIEPEDPAKRIGNVDAAIHTAIARYEVQQSRLSGEELHDVLIMWRAHINEAKQGA